MSNKLHAKVGSGYSGCVKSLQPTLVFVASMLSPTCIKLSHMYQTTTKQQRLIELHDKT